MPRPAFLVTARQATALIRDYLLATIGNPKLFLRALRHVLLRRSRALEGLLNACEAASIARAPAPRTWTDLVLDLAERRGVILLDSNGPHGRIGVADVEFAVTLAELTAACQDVQIRANGAPIKTGALALERALLTARQIEMQFSGPEGVTQRLAVEPYAPRDPKDWPGAWLSSNPENQGLRGVYRDVFAAPGPVTAQDLRGGPTLAGLARQRDVDAVYTWVNHADPAWAALYARHKPATGARPDQTDAAAASRFHSNDELRYSLRSIAANLPWIRQIHVFTNCARPAWLKAEDPRLNWVFHDEVMPMEVLPTFSSHVIESYLHHLPGLSEHFLYINDDVFVTKPLEKTYFFAENGCSRAFLDPYGMVSGPVIAGNPDYLNAARNSAALLHDAFGFRPTQLHQHTVFALRRSVLHEIEARWAAQIEQMRRHKFRTAEDLNVVSFLYHHYAIATGRALPDHAATAFIKPLDIRWRSALQASVKKDLETLCINEGGTEPPGKDWHRTVHQFLAQRFSKPAPWERPDSLS